VAVATYAGHVYNGDVKGGSLSIASSSSGANQAGVPAGQVQLSGSGMENSSGQALTLVDGRIGAGVTSAEAEQLLVGRAPSEGLFGAAAELAAAACSPVSDQRGSADYKRHAAGELARRALRRATGRALRAQA